MKIISNATNGIFDSSSLQDFLKCPRYFYYRWFKGRVKTGANAALLFGSAVHEGIASWYMQPAGSRNKIDAIQAAVKVWSAGGIAGDEKRNLPNLVQTLQYYFNTYAQDGLNFDYVEVDFTVEMPNGTLLCGIIDRINKNGGGNSINFTDTKSTSSQLTDWFWKGYKNDFQMSTYWYAASQTLHAPVSDFTIDAVKVGACKPEHLSRNTDFRTENQLEEWLKTYLWATDFIVAKLKDAENICNWPMNQTSCADYGGCPYLPICQHGWNKVFESEYEQVSTVREM
jgi:hypothetical protein